MDLFRCIARSCRPHTHRMYFNCFASDALFEQRPYGKCMQSRTHQGLCEGDMELNVGVHTPNEQQNILEFGYRNI